MRKSRIIATSLVNSGMALTPEEGERAVEQVFLERFPTEDYGAWNRDVNDETAGSIVHRVGRSSRIQIAQFIRDLWELR